MYRRGHSDEEHALWGNTDYTFVVNLEHKWNQQSCNCLAYRRAEKKGRERVETHTDSIEMKQTHQASLLCINDDSVYWCQWPGRI